MVAGYVETHKRAETEQLLKDAASAGGEALSWLAEKFTELRDWVGKEIGPIAKPKDIRFGDNLPKTRSGKIMRRLLRDKEFSRIAGVKGFFTSDALRAEHSSADIWNAVREAVRRAIDAPPKLGRGTV